MSITTEFRFLKSTKHNEITRVVEANVVPRSSL